MYARKGSERHRPGGGRCLRLRIDCASAAWRRVRWRRAVRTQGWPRHEKKEDAPGRREPAARSMRPRFPSCETASICQKRKIKKKTLSENREKNVGGGVR